MELLRSIFPCVCGRDIVEPSLALPHIENAEGLQASITLLDSYIYLFCILRLFYIFILYT